MTSSNRDPTSQTRLHRNETISILSQTHLTVPWLTTSSNNDVKDPYDGVISTIDDVIESWSDATDMTELKYDNQQCQSCPKLTSQSLGWLVSTVMTSSMRQVTSIDGIYRSSDVICTIDDNEHRIVIRRHRHDYTAMRQFQSCHKPTSQSLGLLHLVAMTSWILTVLS